ncbi:hypothetical protein [Pseudodesulfovibrio karagichevae]|uniref:CopG family transcriptional regulator n=1 Tax=Pseudodesulfovibrio karagichevae TaxID=3239305 RepID=A0ABV4K1C6_9BACT
MTSEHKSKPRTYVLRPDTISFLDGFSETYSISRSALLNLIVMDFQHTLDSITQSDPARGAKVALAFGMKVQQINL